MGKVATEATLMEGVALLRIIARGSVDYFESHKQIQEIVRSGKAAEFFNIGDQLQEKWSDGTNEYDMPFDIVHFGNVVNAKGDTVPAMFLQSHWVLPGIQFDGNEAFWNVIGTAMSAGKYYFTMGNSWGSNVVNGKIYSFTLPTDVPVGGQLLFGTATSSTGALPDQSPANWRVWVYESQTQAVASPREKLELTEESSAPTGATNLGTLSSSTKYATDGSGLNNMQRAAYGYNRWSQSAMRQYLNSDAAENRWWTPKNPFDRAPNELASKRGFMAGLAPEFLEVVQPIKITTALNTISDSLIGTTEVTVDKFWLASLEQEYCVPQLAEAEGEAWAYWKERLGIQDPQASGSANALTEHIRYLISNHTSAQAVRLRSARRGTAHGAWYVTSTGYVYGSGSATSAYCPAPACVIC